MDYQTMLKPELIFLNVDAEDRIDLYQQVAKELLKLGYVKDSYESALNQREDEFPTGVVSDLISIALPHANPENIYKPFVCVVTTRKPIPMLQMGYNTEEQAKVFFFLGITHADDQLILLQKFMALIQDPIFVKHLDKIHDNAEMFTYLTKEFK
ncbi:PTS galactitol transporter subunit IIA [Lactobacillus sp. CBA3606]|uniref:PTS sugar transporter subunit IIA n=1 Tax=Lactobacillus sp. CBA3606 TaxID=2099789 RepID=UPI000CFCEA63|nr:PTS sugar transporter subunit IIA [Lactobacillus sp. CBA3606]AVK64033.1 PTS galactitol transporter subunit IIA [Lactobacillus sp. CBA3606]